MTVKTNDKECESCIYTLYESVMINQPKMRKKLSRLTFFFAIVILDGSYLIFLFL